MEAKLSKDELRKFIDIYLFYLRNPVLAVRDLLGVKLPPHQRLALRLISMSGANYIIILMGRGMGKTFILALLSILFAVMRYSLRVVAVGGGGYRQGKLIMQEIERIINGELSSQGDTSFIKNAVGRKFSQSPIKRETDMWVVPYKNFSKNITVPIGDGNKIRGLRSNVTIIDERKDLSKQIREKVIRPFAFVKKDVVSHNADDSFDNIYIDAGTVEYSQDDFWQDVLMYLQKMEDGDREYLVLKFVYPDAFDVVRDGEVVDGEVFQSIFFNQKLKKWKTVPYNISISEIEKPLTEDNTDIDSWKAEALVRPMDISGNFFGYDIIRSLMDYRLLGDDEASLMSKELGVDVKYYLDIKEECSDPCVIGIDPARESDYASFVVIRVGQLADGEWNYVTQEGRTRFSNVIYAFQDKHMSNKAIVELTYDLLERYNVIGIAMDKGGGGSGVRDEFYEYAIERDLPVIFDPNDNGEGGIATIVSSKKIDNVLPILRLMKFSDRENTVYAHKLRGALQKKLLLFPPDMSSSERDIDRAMTYKYVKTILRQLGWIKTKKTASWLKFYTSNPDKQKKDMFSALLYAYALIDMIIREIDNNKNKKIKNIATYVY